MGCRHSGNNPSNPGNQNPSVHIPGFEGKIITPNEGKLYDKAREQYATSSYPKEEMSPYMIAYCKNNADKDIKLVIDYAIKNDKSIVVRSGGCQYSGLSSGNKQQIVIDMSDYNNIWIKDDNIVTIQPCNELGNIGVFLNKHGVIFPYGDCHCVNIGGHVQTGGFGNLLRGFGLCLDYCISFDIITYNGKKKTIKKPDNDEKYDVYNVTDDNRNEDYDIYWAVMGGNPGSFGIITSYTFRCIKDSDHPNSSGISITYLYSINTLAHMLKAFDKLMKNIENIPNDYDLMMTVASIPQVPGMGVINFEGTYSNLKGKNEEFDPSYFNDFIDVKDAIKVRETFHGKTPLSKMMLRFTLLKSGTREYEYPYIKTLHGSTQIWKEEFISSYCKKVEKLIVADGLLERFKFISQMQLGGGNFYNNDPNSKRTAIANRNIILGFTFDIFYDDHFPWNEDAHKIAKNIQKECEEEWITKEKLFSDNDIRLTWGTFGNTNIEEVWNYYYNPNAKQRYSTLQRIKTYIDPNNLFKTRFTIPLLQ